jgi:hypothetical protein
MPCRLYIKVRFYAKKKEHSPLKPHIKRNKRPQNPILTLKVYT